MAGTLILAALSLLVFNRHSTLDITALNFFGAYGLGMVAAFRASVLAGTFLYQRFEVQTGRKSAALARPVAVA
jgi:hypothetical protein